MTMTELALPRRADLPAEGSSVFLLGIAGAGMRALAMALIAAGYRVSGSDRDDDAAKTLEEQGVRIFPEADIGRLSSAALVVYSSALPETHGALLAARSAGVPTLKRARALGALVNDMRLVAVAGTHGKTTVTAMVALAAEQSGLDPLALVGGHVPQWGANMRPGSGDLAVVEADEYDRSFLELDPDLAVITSLEAEHLDCYGDLETLETAFENFACRAQKLLVCADDPGAMRLAARREHARTYGFAADATYRVTVVHSSRSGQSCLLHTPDIQLPFRLGAPGAHNAQNAAGALAAALWFGADSTSLAGSLEHFQGADRRLQVLFESERLVLIDDYAHHPTEVRASLGAVRSAWPGRRLIVVFQPHLYSRTRDQAAAFADALSGADRALVLPIYAARETPIVGVDRDLIIGAAPGIEAMRPGEVRTLMSADDPTALVFMGAGDVTALAHKAARQASGVTTDALGD
ncbi:MAG: UDP-N-acetylmuramate--L-alanine ligase [Gemmatimonadota bacterium]|nr:UDP-N-acetylmuramate--L-alanine ligase [Gemmatimonadota bacterium]